MKQNKTKKKLVLANNKVKHSQRKPFDQTDLFFGRRQTRVHTVQCSTCAMHLIAPATGQRFLFPFCHLAAIMSADL